MPRALVKGEYTPTGDPVYRDIPLDEIQANPQSYEIAGDVRGALRGEVVSLDPTADIDIRGGGALGAVTGEQAEAAAQQAGAEALHGGIGGGIAAFGEGVLSGVSGGLYDQYVAATGTEAEKRALRERAQIQGEARFGGELLGALSPSIFGKAAGVGAALRATPVGLVERGAARVAALGGATRGGKVAGQIARGAIEGAADSAGQYMAQQALREEPLSAEGIASAVGAGTLFGAGGAATFAGLGRIAQATRDVSTRLDSAIATQTLAKAEREATKKATTALARESGRIRGRIGKLTSEAVQEASGDLGGRVRLSEIVRQPRTPATIRRQAANTIKAIDDSAGLLARTDNALAGMDTTALRASNPALAAELDDVLQARRAAQESADSWGRDFATQTKLAAESPSKRGAALALSDAIDSRGIDTLGALDDTQAALDDVLARVQEASGMPVAPSRASGFYQRLTGAGEKASDLLGAMEVAQTLGVPVPDLDAVPLVGPALSAYAKARFAMGRLGFGTTTKRTNLADKARMVANIATRIEDVGARISAGKIISRALSRALNATELSTLQDNLANVDTGVLEDAMSKNLIGIPLELADAARGAINRKLDYLRENLPKPPKAFSQFGLSDWRPTPTQAMRANAMLRALDAPLDALDAVMSGKETLSTVVRDAIKNVYPDMWRGLQGSVLDSAQEIYRNRPLLETIDIGHFFEVPLAPQLTPQYQVGSMAALPPDVSPQPQLPPPSSINQRAESLERTLGHSLPE